MHPTKRKVNLPSLSFCKNGTHAFTTNIRNQGYYEERSNHERCVAFIEV